MAVISANTTASYQKSNVGIEETSAFKPFDVVSDASDHYYFNSFFSKEKGAVCFSNSHKKIMKEWRILEKHLPESIFVRVYENRIDLLRSVIVGAAGTPYHDGIFFFDFSFPSNYPNQPPQVHYRSHGLRLNPNLYANGRVCLSLLNTWAGKKSERWNPAESTVLQVLLSIQALVLNEKPFFNEPGNGMFRIVICEKQSQAYNEEVFILSCKTMLFLIRRPPKNFEAFVAEHFRERAPEILMAMEAYANQRVQIGYYPYEGSSPSPLKPLNAACSKKFNDSIVELYPLLFQCFRRIGASLGNCNSPIKVAVNEKKTASEKKDGTARKVISGIKKILGLGKKKNKAIRHGQESNGVGTAVIKEPVI